MRSTHREDTSPAKPASHSEAGPAEFANHRSEATKPIRTRGMGCHCKIAKRLTRDELAEILDRPIQSITPAVRASEFVAHRRYQGKETNQIWTPGHSFEGGQAMNHHLRLTSREATSLAYWPRSNSMAVAEFQRRQYFEPSTILAVSCFASQGKIAAYSNTSIRTVRRAIAFLVALSLITCEKKRKQVRGCYQSLSNRLDRVGTVCPTTEREANWREREANCARA